MTAARNYTNVAPPVQFTADVSSGAVLWPVTSTTGYPEPPFLLGAERGTANQEVALCTDLSPDSFTVERGYDDTEPVAHSAGKSVEHTTAAIDFAEAGMALDLITTHLASKIAHLTVVSYPAKPLSPQAGQRVMNNNLGQARLMEIYDGVHWQVLDNLRVLAAPQHGLGVGALPSDINDTGFFLQFDSVVISTNSAGGSAVFFPVPFPNSMVDFLPIGGAEIAPGLQGLVITPLTGQYFNDRVGVIAHTAGGAAVGSALVRVNYVAFGT